MTVQYFIVSGSAFLDSLLQSSVLYSTFYMIGMQPPTKPISSSFTYGKPYFIKNMSSNGPKEKGYASFIETKVTQLFASSFFNIYP